MRSTKLGAILLITLSVVEIAVYVSEFAVKHAEDQTAEVSRLTELGAQEVHWDRRPLDADYVIMEDPEGNRFCIIDAHGWSGWTQRISADSDEA